MRPSRSGSAAGRPTAILSAAIFLLVPGQGLAGRPAKARENHWAWTGSSADHRAILIRLARGSLRIVRRPGPVKILLRARSPTEDPRSVAFEVIEGSQQVTVVDRYPRGLGSTKECLPPMHERGAFWEHDVVVDALVHAPKGVSVTSDIMDPRV